MIVKASERIETKEDREDFAVFVPGTFDAFREWYTSDEAPDRGRFTFVDGGVIIDMSPERIDAHNQVKQAINLSIGSLVRQRDLGQYFPDGVLITNEYAGVANEPDGTFASWDTLRTGRLREVRRSRDVNDGVELEGTPDWVCEIVSPTSVRKDTKLLFEAYYRAGIPEYWLIDARGEAIDFRILTRGRLSYEVVPTKDGWIRSAVFGVECRLDRHRNPVGGWTYDLHTR